MTSQELLRQMHYDDAEQLGEAEKYIAIKGIVQYQRVIDYCKSENELPSYTRVAALYRYDKRLRDNLYVYLATAEEFMRACIGNQYEDNEDFLSKTQSFIKKQQSYHSISLTLEQLTLKELIDMVFKNKDVFKEIYDFDYLKMNLDAFRILRNKVSHHNFY